MTEELLNKKKVFLIVSIESSERRRSTFDGDSIRGFDCGIRPSRRCKSDYPHFTNPTKQVDLQSAHRQELLHPHMLFSRQNVPIWPEPRPCSNLLKCIVRERWTVDLQFKFVGVHPGTGSYRSGLWSSDELAVSKLSERLVSS